MKQVTIYTDGACSGNPGPGGWCAILLYKGTEKTLSGGKKLTTNNEMELTAVTSGGSVFTGWSGCTPVEGAPEKCRVTIAEGVSVTATFK